jgi:hypothetical protein
MKIILSQYALFFVSSLICGCASNGFMMAKPSVTLYGGSYPSKKSDAEIEVYQTKKPDSSYVEIGQITCGDTEDDWNMKQILDKARDIGADGIIIVGRSRTYGVGVPVGNMEIATSEGYGITAIAFKYK